MHFAAFIPIAITTRIVLLVVLRSIAMA